MRVVCLGGDLTWIGKSAGTDWPTKAGQLTGAEFINKGVYNGTSLGMKNRFTSDVLAYSPDIVIIFGGEYDILNNDYTVAPNVVLDNLLWCANTATANGITPVLGLYVPINPASGVGQTVIDRFNTMTTYIAAMGKAYSIEVANFYDPFFDPTGSLRTDLYLSADVYPSPAGCLRMAAMGIAFGGLKIFNKAGASE